MKLTKEYLIDMGFYIGLRPIANNVVSLSIRHKDINVSYLRYIITSSEAESNDFKSIECEFSDDLKRYNMKLYRQFKLRHFI